MLCSSSADFTDYFAHAEVGRAELILFLVSCRAKRDAGGSPCHTNSPQLILSAHQVFEALATQNCCRSRANVENYCSPLFSVTNYFPCLAQELVSVSKLEHCLGTGIQTLPFMGFGLPSSSRVLEELLPRC
jgi:hypothetical protein